MSLADELLADLEEAAEEEEGGSYGEEEEEPAIEDVQEETQLDLSGDSVKTIAKLWDSKMVRGQEAFLAGALDRISQKGVTQASFGRVLDSDSPPLSCSLLRL